MKRKLKLYSIDLDYMEYLHSRDKEVYYHPSYQNHIKPFVGIVIPIKEIHYFIPLTSPKPKHKKWKNSSKQHMLIYELLSQDKISDRMIYKTYSNKKVLHILSVLDIKKMIPAPKGMYHKIDFKTIEDVSYKTLLQKEYQFCIKHQDKIIQKAISLYQKQNDTKQVHMACTNLTVLESAMEEYIQSYLQFEKPEVTSDLCI